MVILHLFVYVQFIIHFMLLALNYAHLGACPSVLAWLTLASAKQARTNLHATVLFTRTKQPHTLPIICRYSCATAVFQHWKPAVTGHSNVQHLDQYSRQRHVATFQGHLVCHVLHVPTHAQKVFNLNFDFSRNVMGLLRQELNFISM